jgi:hypothetical protein
MPEGLEVAAEVLSHPNARGQTETVQLQAECGSAELVRLLSEAAYRVKCAEENAQTICIKAIKAIRAAQLRVDEAEQRAQRIASHATAQIKLLHERFSASTTPL